MKILFTGSSSFTGYWFIKTLADAGHEVVATFNGSVAGYSDVRGRRVEMIAALCRAEFDSPFGSERFISIVSGEKNWDLLCHHAADMANYKSPDFDVVKALGSNTNNIRGVLAALRSKGCARVLLTGSVFEQNEGAGSDGMRSFSPYGLSKGLTSEMFRYYAWEAGMSLGKFVIPNPFGPYEEPRFTAYLVKSWYEGKTPQVGTPAYVRDNIHVALLAGAYARFAGQLSADGGFHRHNPSGYAESQGAFARRFAQEMEPRFGIPCPVTFADQREFPEPRVRINTEPVAHLFPEWCEQKAWDELAEYYRETFHAS